MPTINDVKPHYRELVYAPSKEVAALGAIVTMPGAIGCPWCDGRMLDEEGRNACYTVGVCDKDPSHLAWCLPWGG